MVSNKAKDIELTKLGTPRQRAPGAGRKPIGDREDHKISITSKLWQKAVRIGGGKPSEGIRIALDAFKD